MRRFLETNSKASPGVRLSRRQARAFCLLPLREALPLRLFALRSNRLRGPGSLASLGEEVRQEGSENKFPEEAADSPRPVPATPALLPGPKILLS